MLEYLASITASKHRVPSFIVIKTCLCIHCNNFIPYSKEVISCSHPFKVSAVEQLTITSVEMEEYFSSVALQKLPLSLLILLYFEKLTK